MIYFVKFFLLQTDKFHKNLPIVFLSNSATKQTDRHAAFKHDEFYYIPEQYPRTQYSTLQLH